MVMHVELQATCGALGYQEGDQYVREPDCIETVKDLIKFLKREDEFCDIRRQLGHAQIVKRDLIPLVKQYRHEATLWETVIRLLVNLTQPAVLCFNGFVPEVKSLRQSYLDVVSHLQTMKEAKANSVDPDEILQNAAFHQVLHCSPHIQLILAHLSRSDKAFIDEGLFSVITEKLGELLKLDWEHRQEEDRLLIERLLILIRNILHVPADPAAEQRTDDDASIHDQVLWAMHVSGLEDLLLYIACSEEERNLSMHILEIISLMFREQTPEMLASAGVQRSLTEKEKDERELEAVREQERIQKKANIMKFSTRHSKFGGTYVVKNMKSISENDLIYHKSQADVSKITLDMNKKPKKKAKNRKPIIEKEVVRRSTLSIRLSLKEFCVNFLENCYNPLMYAVKDILNREKSQEHDETYYLWAIKFFMEFCRLHFKQIDNIGETMSVPAFHYIQVQLYEYYEMQTMEKKEAIVWGNRIHLALKAYQELLMTLDFMDRSGNPTLKDSSRVIKSNIFYMMEFRDIFLTLLRHFNQSKQSRTYLKDLIETTHLFLKMLENFSKNSGHLVVEKKKKKTVKKKKQPNRATSGPTEPTEQELEDLWDEISSELSAIFQGRMDIPTDVTPFDAASEVEVDEQRASAMIRIQDSLRSRQAGEAVALFRAAREVWPERNEFGTPDIAPEDEFMALREIFMTPLPRPQTETPLEEPVEEQDEVEEDELSTVVASEQEFVFQEYIIKFAKPDILKTYVLLLADFQKNSSHTNRCCIKMLHRIAFDRGCTGMVFQASLFRVFQKILLSPLAKSDRYKELVKFATYVVRKFVETAEKNPKVFMELLFWKTNKESVEIVDGYGSYQGKSKVLWSEDAELEVRRLFDEYRDVDAGDKDTVDCIMERITDPSKTRSQIIRELKKQELIDSAKDLKKPKKGARAGPWREEHELELRELFDRYKNSDDPVGQIINNMTAKRGKSAVMEKILSLGLVEDRKELYKKRGSKNRRKSRRGGDDSDNDLQELPSDFEEDGMGEIGGDSDRGGNDNGSSHSESDSSSSDSDDDDDDGQQDVPDSSAGSGEVTMAGVIANIVNKGYKEQIGWIRRVLSRTADDREEDGIYVPVPIVPLTEENETAMEDDVFLSFLSKIGLAAPADENEAFWRIPDILSVLDLRNIIAGLALDDNDVPIAADRIKMRDVPKGKKKEKRNKREKRKKEDKPVQKKKNANKFAVLKDLVKKRAEAKKTKRNRHTAEQIINKDDSSSDEESIPSLSTGGQKSSPIIGSAKKKRRVKKFAKSDSEDSDDDRLQIAETDVQEDDLRTQSAQGQSSQVSGSQSQEEPESQPFVLPSSSDSEDDSQQQSQNDSKVAEGTQSNKRSRLMDSDSGSDNEQPTKKARIVDSDSDDDDNRPQTAAPSETFPATLYTQGPESDSDLDDHVPLRKVLQKKNMIESDDDD